MQLSNHVQTKKQTEEDSTIGKECMRHSHKVKQG